MVKSKAYIGFASRFALTLILSIAIMRAVPAHAQLKHDAAGPPVSLLPYAPTGTLFDNQTNNGTTSLASQNSTGTLTARTADDFTIDGAGCGSGTFNITRIRAQIVQADAAPQPFGIEIYADNGSGTAPTPAGSIVPIAAFGETSQVSLGGFGIGTSIFEASFDTPGLQLNGNTTYWISAFGANGAANSASFNNFFAASAGAVGDTPNGVIIAPGAGVAVWTPAEQVIGPPALAFSFAIDGRCSGGTPAPALGGRLLPLAVGLLMLTGAIALRRRATC